jgi:hypothetical protein
MIIHEVLTILEDKRNDGRQHREQALGLGYECQESEFWAGYVKALDEVEHAILERLRFPFPSE